MTYFVGIGPAPTNAHCAQLGQMRDFDSFDSLDVRQCAAALQAGYEASPTGPIRRSQSADDREMTSNHCFRARLPDRLCSAASHCQRVFGDVVKIAHREPMPQTGVMVD